MPLSTNLIIVDPETGSIIQKEFRSVDARHHKNKEYIYMRTVGAKSLASAKLSGSEFRVLYALIGSCSWANRVHLSKKLITELTGVNRVTVYHALNTLAERGLVVCIVDEPDTYLVHPKVCWRGEPHKWDQAHRDFVSAWSHTYQQCGAFRFDSVPDLL